MENAEKTDAGWVRLYHASGVQVGLPVRFDRIVTKEEWTTVYGNVSNALEAGWLIQAPGMEEGEEKEDVGYVVRFQKEDTRTGGMTEVVDLYSPNDAMKHKLITVYLNTADDVAAFERASGMQISRLPIYLGTGHIERGKDRRLDAMVVKAPRTFQVAHVKNPRFKQEDEDAAKKSGQNYFIPRRRFSRWIESSKPAPPPVQSGPPVTPQQASELCKFMGIIGATDDSFQKAYGCLPAELPASRYTEARDRLKAAADKAIQKAGQG